MSTQDVEKIEGLVMEMNSLRESGKEADQKIQAIKRQLHEMGVTLRPVKGGTIWSTDVDANKA